MVINLLDGVQTVLLEKLHFLEQFKAKTKKKPKGDFCVCDPSFYSR